MLGQRRSHRQRLPPNCTCPPLIAGEVAHRMAGHSNAKTSGLYDRRNDDISVGEVERIGISLSSGAAVYNLNEYLFRVNIRTSHSFRGLRPILSILLSWSVSAYLWSSE